MTKSKIFQKITTSIQTFYKFLDLKKEEFLLIIIIGSFSILLMQHMQLRREFNETQEIVQTMFKKTGLKIYKDKDLVTREIGDIFVQIPEEWTNIIPDYFAQNGIRKHYVASFGEDFGFPFANEYAFAVGVERRGVQTDLETFLKTKFVSSDPEGARTNLSDYKKVNDEMFFIERDSAGWEYFRKIDDTVIVIFVYDNGDREIDDFEQKFINSVGLIESDTLFDYK